MTLSEKAALLSGKDVWHTRALERLGIPSRMFSDGPSGLRKQAAAGDHLGFHESTRATCIPSAATLANSWDPVLTERMGALVGAEAAAQGVDVLLAPGLNVKRSPLCGRNFEYYSEDPYLSGKLAAGFIRGVQSRGVAACAKHFAANNQEHCRMSSDSVVDERTLREIYLTNFEIAIREGHPRAVMSAYNKLNGRYASENPYLLQKILREEWGYTGIVVTDWGGGNDFVEGVRAGMNLEMPAAADDSPYRLMQAVREGRISEADVDQRVDELLDLLLIARPTSHPTDPEAHHQAALEAAEKSLVLLKNEGCILPLSKEARVAIIGDFAAHSRYQGAGSSQVNAAQVDHTLDLLDAFFPRQIGYAQGFERQGEENERLARQALALAQGADAVLFYMGLPESCETEGMDRTHLRLPDNQIDLLERIASVNPHVIVVLSCGGAVEIPWIDCCQALIYGGLGGQAMAGALLRALTGTVNPGGKLSETFPMAYADLPVSCYYPGAERTAEYREGLFVGYRYFTTTQAPSRFPFGFGLSFTQFSYAHLTLDAKGVSFDLTNCGNNDGDEIAQVYVSLPGARIFRPQRELKGFRRISLKKGETRRIQIPFDAYTFRYFNALTHRFEVEAGIYEILIGASSEDIRLRGTLAIPGTDAPNPYAEKPMEGYLTGNAKNVTDQVFSALLGYDPPEKDWNRGTPLEMNNMICQMAYAKNPVARLMARFIQYRLAKEIAAGKTNLNLMFIYRLPFRGLAKMTGGMISMAMAEDILLMVNGHWHRGLGRLIFHYFHKPDLNRS